MTELVDAAPDEMLHAVGYYGRLDHTTPGIQRLRSG